MIRVAALAAALLALAGCNDETKKAGEVGSLGVIKVWRDEARGVTCWVFDGYQKGGLSCVPDWMLDRGAHDEVQP